MNTNADTTFIRYSEPTVRANVSQAYSQCLPEPSYGYAPEPQYGHGSYYGEQAPMPQQPLPVQAPAAKSSSAGKGLMFVAGLAVIGAAAFGGVYLMNSASPENTTTTSAAPAAAEAPVVNLPSAIDIPALVPAQNAPAPVIVNNPAPIHVSGQTSAPRSIASQKPVVSAQKPNVAAQKPIAAPAPAAAAPAPAPAPAPKGPDGVKINTPFGQVGVGQNGTSVKTPGAEIGVGQNGTSVDAGGVKVGVPGQNGGQLEIGVGQPQEAPKEAPKKQGDEAPQEKVEDAPKEEVKDAPKEGGNALDVVDKVVDAQLPGALDAASGVQGG